MATYPNPWLLNGKEFDDNDTAGFIGFVYKITGPTGKSYIGKKILWFARRKIKKGKRPKLYKAPSDWKTYYGSSEELSIDIEKLGAENFKREILMMCKTKTEMSYYEAKIQFELGVLESDDYYNRWISCKIRTQIRKDNT
jgi:hypothetical protein